MLPIRRDPGLMLAPGSLVVSELVNRTGYFYPRLVSPQRVSNFRAYYKCPQGGGRFRWAARSVARCSSVAPRRTIYFLAVRKGPIVPSSSFLPLRSAVLLAGLSLIVGACAGQAPAKPAPSAQGGAPSAPATSAG